MTLAVCKPDAGQAKVYLSVDEALQSAFDCQTEKKSVFLTDQQKKQIESSAKFKPPRIVYEYYCPEQPDRVAYFQTLKVRTLPATFFVIIGRDHRVEHNEIISFREPSEYKPPQRWFKQFDGKKLEPALAVDQAIRRMSGATLSSRASVRAARLALASYAVLHPAANDATPITQTTP